MAGAQERAYLATPANYAAGKIIASPFQFSTSYEDNLRVRSVNAASGVRISVQGRRLNEKGDIDAFQFPHTPHTDRTVATSIHALGQGAILNAVVFVDAGTPLLGQTYVLIEVVRGFAGPVVLLGTLLAGYITGAQSLGFPGSPLQHSNEGPGVLRSITGTDPPQGSEISETVPTNARWLLEGFAASLNPLAGPATRYPSLLITDGTNVVGGSTATRYNSVNVSKFVWTPGAPVTGSDDYPIIVSPLAYPMTLLGGYQITTSEPGMGAGVHDDWGAPTYLVREWLEVP